MVIERKIKVPGSPIPVPQLRKQCLDCENCQGICTDVIQMGFLQEVLNVPKEVRL